MNIGNVIRTKRRAKDMTQEDLAEVLGVSVSAVSLWESGKTMPDMGLVPAICSVLEVSADELFGIDAENRENEIMDIIYEADKYGGRGYLEDGVKIIEDGLKEFPDSWMLITNLMHYCYQMYMVKKSNTAAKDRAVELGEKILEKCTDEDIRASAVQKLVFIYSETDPERAEKLANKMGDIYTCRDVLLTRTLKGEKRFRASQDLINTCLDFAVRDIWVNSRESDFYTRDEKAQLWQKCVDLYRLMFEDEDYGFYHTRLQECEIPLAAYYADNRDYDNTLVHLCVAAEHAIEFVKYVQYKSDEFVHTSLVLRGRTAGGFTTSNRENNALVMTESLNEPRYDFIRNTDEFKKILSDLAEYAGEWEKTE